MSDPIVKVERNLFAYWKPAKLSTQYGAAPWYQTLPDDARYQMGGDTVVHFFGQLKDGRWTLLNRAPPQDW